MTLVHKGVDETNGVIEMGEAIVKMVGPPKELEAPPKVKELTRGHDHGDDFVEAEVVDESSESATPKA